MRYSWSALASQASTGCGSSNVGPGKPAVPRTGASPSLCACTEVPGPGATRSRACRGRDEAELGRRAAAIGRKPDELRENGLAGTPTEIVDKLGQFAEIGTTRVYLQILDLSDLEHLELIADQILPQVL